MSRPVEWRAGGPLRMMAARGASSSLGRRLSGLAIPFGSETVIGNFTEVIRPGAVHLHRDTDVRLLWSHDPATVLGRTGSTLALSTTARGITFAADLPSWASGLIETIQRGDVSGMSFGFVVREDLWEQPSSDRPPRRTILDLELHEISVVATPVACGEAAIVRQIFRLSAEGSGIKPIAKQLNAEGAPCPRAQQGRPTGWAPSSVREILHRPLYRGEVVWNKTKKRNAWGQVQQQVRPEDEWLRVDLPELRIVNDKLWKAVQARLTQARKVYLRGTNGQLWGRPTGGVESKYLLPGLARCGVCGGGLYVKSRSHGTRRAYFYGQEARQFAT